jgi:MGT family glycosyltransferase
MAPRILFTYWPFVGHVLPQMSIATVLRDHGCDVAFYTGPSAGRMIEPEGMRLFPFERLDEAAGTANVARLEAGVRHGRARPGVIRRTLRDWLVETIPAQLEDLEAIVARWQPDVVVTDLSMWGPIVVLWEKTGIPVTLSCTFLGPLVPGRDAPPPGFGMRPPRTPSLKARAWAMQRLTDAAATPVRRRVDEFRAGHGLPPMGCSVNEFTGRLPLYLVLGLRELDYGRRDLPAAVRYMGACVWMPPEPPGTLEWLDRLDRDRPWVHVTESTLHNSDPFLLRAAAQGLARSPVEAILTTGGDRDPQTLDLGAAAPNVHVTRWLSHRELLPRCAAVVTTGGAGTIMAALRAGVPLVIVPTTWDKPDNARRVVEAGVGVQVSPRRCTPEALRAAVEQVIRDPAYRAAAERMAALIAAAPGPDGAAELIEGLVGASAQRVEAT